MPDAKIFFPIFFFLKKKIWKKILEKKSDFVSNNCFCFFFKIKNPFKFFSKMHISFKQKLFSKKKFFKQKSFTLIKMLIFSKLFIWHLSRGIVKIESAGKVAAIGKKRSVIGWKRIDERASFVHCTTFKLRTNSFCRHRVGLEVLIKVTSNADGWKESEKKFYQALISYCIFFNNVTFIKTSNPTLCRQKKFVLN